MPVEWRSKLKIDDQAVVDIATRSAIASIRVRTSQGLDETGRPFRPYSPEYAERRRAIGLKSKVDLHVTGAMLGSLRLLRWRRGRRGIELEIGPDAAVGRAPPSKSGSRTIASGGQSWTMSFIERPRRPARSIPNNLKAMYVSRWRRFLGLREKDLARMASEIRRRALKGAGERQRDSRGRFISGAPAAGEV